LLQKKKYLVVGKEKGEMYGEEGKGRNCMVGKERRNVNICDCDFDLYISIRIIIISNKLHKFWIA